MRPHLIGLVRQAFRDQYQVDREVGHGSAARVFLASDSQGQRLALKILHPECLEGVESERFLREIRLTTGLDHPHIARPVAFGEREWLIYLAMKFVDGPTLREVLARHWRLGVADTLRLAGDLLDALGYAHERGIVHRDVKPENVVISSDRGAVLLDFGIARQLAPRRVVRSHAAA